jgi:hypothetical protein
MAIRTDMRPGMRRTIGSLVALVLALSPPSAPVPVVRSPTITYTLRVDSAKFDQVDVAIRFRGAAEAFHLAMKVHAEYDARYWHYLSDLRLDGSGDDSRANAQRQDSTLWLVTLPGGRGVVHYRIHIQPAPTGLRRAWRTYARADGALINPPDVFLYSPEFADAPVALRLDVPHDWQIATALPSPGPATRRRATDAAALLDAPILMGHFYRWAFTDRGTAYRVAYWPLPVGAARDRRLGAGRHPSRWRPHDDCGSHHQLSRVPRPVHRRATRHAGPGGTAVEMAGRSIGGAVGASRK